MGVSCPGWLGRLSPDEQSKFVDGPWLGRTATAMAARRA